MFIVAVSDNGQERNIVANEVILSNGKVLVQAGGQRHEFAIAALIDVSCLSRQASSVVATRFSSAARCLTEAPGMPASGHARQLSVSPFLLGAKAAKDQASVKCRIAEATSLSSGQVRP